MSRKRPLGKPLALDDAALDAASTVTPADQAGARALWQHALQGTEYEALAGLLDATAKELDDTLV